MSQYNYRGDAPARRAAQNPQRPPVRQGAYAPRRPAAPQRPRTAPNPQRPPVYRPAPTAPKARRGMPDGLWILIGGGIAAIVLAFVLQSVWHDGFPLARKEDTTQKASAAITEIYSGGPIRINEVMCSNMHTLSIADGTSPDWIEVANTGKNAVQIGGYSLSKTANSATVFTFPDMTINAGECIIVYADSKLRETAGEDLHAPFRLSSAGDTLLLFNAGGTAIDTLNLPAMGRDVSYSRVSASQWQISDMPTPGLFNTEENYRALHEKVANSPVILSEIVASNASVYADASGQYYDYIEIINRSGETVDLTGWHLSDDESNLRKWAFPALTLAPGEAKVIFASGLDRVDDPSQLHTNFRLSTEGETVLLCNAQGRIMDSTAYSLLKSNVAMSLLNDGSWTVDLAPTPGRANQ